MSIDEHVPRTYSQLLNEWQEYERYQAAGFLVERVNEKIGHLNDMRPSHPNTPEEMVAILVSTLRAEQMRRLSMLTFTISTEEDTEKNIDLTESLFEGMSIPFPPEFREHQDEFIKAAQLGERMGTEDFLESLVPSHITNPADREVYFSSWNRDLFQEIHRSLERHSDGSASGVALTDMPNIGVRYNYALLKEIPERTISYYRPQ